MTISKTVSQLFSFIFITIVLFACSSGSSSKEKDVRSEEDVSYKGLKTLLESDQAIPVNYLVNNPKDFPQKALYDNTILQESENFILIRSRDDAFDAKNYYLLSFSTKTGKLISFIGLGQEAEGVDPYKINWHSKQSFSTIDYQYELLVDEESGAYVKGKLQDSTVLSYELSKEGMINSLTANQ